MNWIGNWVADKAAGVLKTGIEAGGNLAGNAVGGVGTLIESTGRGLGNSAGGAIGGVGAYINNYGNGIKNSMAPSGTSPSSSVEKKTAVKPTTSAATKTASNAQKALPAAVSTVPKALPSPASASTKPKAPPPAKTAADTRKPSTPSGRPAPSRPAVSTGQSARTADGKVRIAASSRPKPAGVSKPIAKPLPASTPAKNPTSSAAKRSQISGAQKTADGKVKISAASRPRPVKV